MDHRAGLGAVKNLCSSKLQFTVPAARVLVTAILAEVQTVDPRSRGMCGKCSLAVICSAVC